MTTFSSSSAMNPDSSETSKDYGTSILSSDLFKSLIRSDKFNLRSTVSLSAMTMMIMMQLLDWFSFCRDFLSTGKNMMPIDHREPSPYRFVIKLCDRFFVQGRFLGERLI